MQIWKYQLPIEKLVHAIDMPMHSVILTAQVQFQENLVLWARVWPHNVTHTRWIYLLETGKDLPAYKIINYINTVQFWDGDYVLHVYEGMEPDDR